MRVALITGAAKRIGAEIARNLHAADCHVVIHYHQSRTEAEALAHELNQRRPDSARALAANLQAEPEILAALVQQAAQLWGQLDILVNNASSFYPTPIGTITAAQWADLVSTNWQAPLFLAQAATPHLQASPNADCSVINLVDTPSGRRRAEHAVYGSAKAGLATLTEILARDLGPKIRVNGIAPGAILWPEGEDDSHYAEAIANIPLQRVGTPAHIASLANYLCLQNDYITGQVIAVDGGRNLTGV